MNTIFGNFLERTIPNLKNAIINLTIGGNTAEMNLEDFKTVMAPEPSYKVYTALVSQSGVDDPISIDTGSLTIGVTYYINNNSPGMDFTNVGAPNNIAGESTYFVATGTTPASWGSSEDTGNDTIRYNVGAPTVTVLENTIGNIWFTYSNTGIYYINSNGLFLSNKTWTYPNNTQSIPTDGGGFITFYISNANLLTLEASNDDIISADSNPLRLEIRVYN